MNKTMETKNINSDDKILKGVLKSLEDVLSGLQEDLHTSNNLLELGIKDYLAHKTEQMVKNPLASYVELYKNIRDIIWKNLEEIFDNAFKVGYSEYCEAIFKSHRVPDTLLYYIILKENSESNQDLFTDLFYGYNKLGPGKNFPIQIIFVPKEVACQLNDGVNIL